MKFNLKNIYQFYINGFREMTVGKTLWLIIAIKLIVMFAILKVFFFPNFLQSKATSQQEKSDYVGEQLSNPAQQ